MSSDNSIHNFDFDPVMLPPNIDDAGQVVPDGRGVKERYLTPTQQQKEIKKRTAEMAQTRAQLVADRMKTAFRVLMFAAGALVGLFALTTPIGWIAVGAAIGVAAVAIGILIARHIMMSKAGLKTDSIKQFAIGVGIAGLGVILGGNAASALNSFGISGFGNPMTIKPFFFTSIGTFFSGFILALSYSPASVNRKSTIKPDGHEMQFSVPRRFQPPDTEIDIRKKV